MVSIQLPELLNDESLESVQEAMESLRQETADFESFIGEMLDELEATRLEMVEHQKQLVQDRRALERRENDLTHVGSPAESVDAEARIRDLEAERDQMRAELDKAVGELTEMAKLSEALRLKQIELYERQRALIEQNGDMGAASTGKSSAETTNVASLLEDDTTEAGSLEDLEEWTREIQELHQQLSHAAQPAPAKPVAVQEVGKDVQNRTAPTPATDPAVRSVLDKLNKFKD